MKKLAWLLVLLPGIALAAAAQNSSIVAGDTCKRIDAYLSSLEKEKGFSGALLIVKDGRKIFSKGYGWADKASHVAFTPSTLASMGSITKAFTATAIMKLYQQGKLSPSDKLQQYFPTVPPDKANISLHQLLTHSSGFHEIENDGGDYEKIETAAYLQRIFSAPLAFKPGERAVYSNVNFSLLAILVEKISGMDYETFLARELFQPAGIAHLGYQYPAEKDVVIAHGYQEGKDWGTHQSHFEKAGGGPWWNLKGNGGLEASLDDMFLWANAFSNKSILPDSLIDLMFTPHIAEYGTDGHYYFGYGCNISTNARNTKEIDNGGSNHIYFARLTRLPQEGLVFYLVTNESSVGTDKVMPNIRQLYFRGAITQDFLNMRFDNPQSEKVYDLLVKTKGKDLESAIKNAGVTVDDDMVLLNVGRVLTEEKKEEEALALYEYYTRHFPNIVVAWNDLGDIYFARNNKQKAAACYQAALKLKPQNQRAREGLEKATR